MNGVKIFMVDDNLYFINAAIDFLNTEPSFDVLGYAMKGEEAIDTIQQEQPQIVIVDYVMSGMNGLEVTKNLKATTTSPIVIMVSQFDTSDYADQAIINGADGFVPKSKFGEEIIPLIKRLANSGI